MNQAGASGNDSIATQIGSALKANADGEYDTKVLSAGEAQAAAKSTVGCRRRRRTRRKRRRKKRKSKKKRKSRRKSKKRRRKSKKRRR